MECLYRESVSTRLHRLLVVSLQILGSPGLAGREAAVTAAGAAAALEAARAQAGVPDSPWQACASLAEPAVQGT